jgi:methionyl-tRNA formyltransferase
MLDCLIEAGFIPTAVIEEKSSLAIAGKTSLISELEKIASEIPLPSSLAEIIAGYDIQYYEVADHNDEKSVQIIKDINPQLIVLGDTQILKPYMLDLAPMGIVNVHPGYLPDVKGNNPYIWAIVKDWPQGCTVHFIDRSVDTGPVILRRKLFLQRGQSYQHLLGLINILCGELLVEALTGLFHGTLESIDQSEIPRETPEIETFRLAPPEIKAIAIAKLNEGTYKHLT